MEFNEILENVAKKNNATPEEVYTEMQKALNSAFASDNPKVREEWSKIPFEGELPMPEEVIPFLVARLMLS